MEPSLAPSEPPASPPTVLFIGGLGRSGSTLLDLMLGNQERFCAVGELSYIWLRGLRDNELCGCGSPFRECPFWSDVGRVAFGGWEALDVLQVLSLRRSLDRNRHIPRLMGSGRNTTSDRALERYSDLLTRLYRAIRDVSAASVIVDSTKHASSAFLLARGPDIDLRIVHLVRDGRGVAHSWTKEVRKPEVTDGTAYLDRYRPARIGSRWVAYNGLFHILRRRRDLPSRFVRYEDLVRDPRGELVEIIELAGERATLETLQGVGDDWVEVRPSHTIAGNPMRFTSDRMPLRVDDAWRRDMQPWDRLAVSAIALPLLVPYGYVGGRR
jgi:hypothetical protein